MRKIYLSSLLAKKFLFLVTGIFCFFLLKAQTDISIGTGTAGNTGTTYPAPLQDYFEGSRAQYLYRASEFVAAGMSPGNVSAIKFNVTNLNAFSGNIQQYTIKIGTSVTASLGTTTWENVPNTVYGPTDYVPALGVNTFTFSTPFFWNGTDNIVIEICNGLPANTTDGLNHFTQNVTVPWTIGLPFNGSRTYAADNAGNLCNSAATTATGTPTTRPNITFTWTSATACTGTPAAGTATSTASSVCLGQSFTLSSSGVTVASGLTYQWQSSADNINWTNIAGATTLSYTTSQSVTTYYRVVVTCTAGGAAASSTSVLVTLPSLISGTFTINKGVPTNIPAGTFNSFNDAYNYIKCGINGAVIFNVLAGSGPYPEQLIMQSVPGASATNTITFNGNGNTLSFTSANTNERAVIKLNDADFITFDNLVIEAGGTTTTQYGFGVQLINNADFNKFNGCTINVTAASTSTNYAGIVVSSSATSATTTGDTKCDNNIFSNNTVTGGYYGITLVGSTTSAVQANQVINNTFKEFYFYGIYLSGNFNTLVENNSITRPTRSTVTTTYGIYVTSLNTKLNITRNRIYNLFGGAPASTSALYGIYITGTDALAGLENVVSNNAVYNTNTNGDVYGIYNLGSDNVWYYHNTVVLDGAAATSTSTTVTRGFYQTTAAAGIEFKNNIIAISRGGIGPKHAIYFNTATSTIVSNNNDFFISSTTGNNFVGYYTANRATLPDWQTASSQDAASITSNPLFQDTGTGNYSPTNASMNDRGTPVGITVDINNAIRSTTTPDIGAWEFAPGACAAPPVAGIAVAAPNPVCVNSSVSLTLTGNSVGSGQTYQWQTSATLTGTYTNIGNVLTNLDTTIIASATLYYRVAVTCGSSTVFSQPVLVTITPALPSNTYTIDKNNPTTYPATGLNFNSFNAAKTALQCGIAGPIVFTVVSGTGPYDEQLILDSIPGASSVNTITFNGNGNTIRFSSNNTDERAVIKLRRADHILFDSLVIDATGTGTYGYGVQLVNDADSNTFRKCTMVALATSTSTFFSGIVINATEQGTTTTGNTLCDGNTFDRNTVTGGYYGLTLVGSNTSAVQNNKITGNTFTDWYGYGIYLSGSFNTLAEGNNISRPVRTTNAFTVYGIYVTGLNVKTAISRNRIHNPFGGAPTSTSTFGAIYITGVDALTGVENVVSNNAIYYINGNGLVYGIYNSGSDNVFYFHNTISIENTNAITAAAYGFYQTIEAAGIDFRNNLISIKRGGTGNKYALYFSTSTSAIISNNNSFYVEGQNSFVGYNGANRATLPSWQTATAQDSASVFANPFFVNPASGNLSPTNPAIDNKGVPVGITTDILGNTRSTTTPDIGAWEFAIPACTAPPAGGTATANPASGICLGAEIDLSLIGANILVSGQTYQWQYASSASGPWTNLGSIISYPDTTIFATITLYYRVVVTCSGQSANSAPVLVTLNPTFPGGVYTINPANPVVYPANNNFTSFAAAVAIMECGITDDVTFNIAPGTYTEQIRMHRIAGASQTSRVRFQSADGNAASVILTHASTTAAANYTLKLDSASYITYRNMTINATNATNGRAVELASTASYDSLANLIINVPASTSTSNVIAGIYAATLTGTNQVLRANTINGGSSGIYFAGGTAPNNTRSNRLDSNTINGSYYYGIYVSNTQRSFITNNTVNKTLPSNTTSYSIYATNVDSAYQFVGNKVTMTGLVGGTHYGMYLTSNNADVAERGRVANNKIVAGTGNTGILYGLYQTNNTFNNTVNNVISINTTGTSSYSLYSTGGGDLNYYNNSIHNTSTSTGVNNYAAYFTHTSGSGADVRNNILAHGGGGKAMYMANDGFVSTDYNMLYTTGATLVQRGTPAGTFATLNAWRTASGWDQNSIVFKPAFTSDTDLMPDIADSTVWAVHGRGVQVPGNDLDFNNNPRPTTLAAGVPDLGAYEFLPTVAPMPLQGNPITPAAGTTQVFMFGTDTVSKITWASASTVPSAIAVRRYSGVLPTGTTPAQKAMYFYTKFDVTGTTTPTYNIEQFYIDPWQGFISREPVTRLGRTNTSGAWVMDPASRVDTVANVIRRDTLSFMDRFTGLTDSTIAPPPPPVYVQQIDSSNRGKQFWVAYAHSWDFYSGSNSQNMVLYLCTSSQPATVTVRINGTSWARTYTIPANTAITSDIIPKTGLYDARLLTEGVSARGIRIESDVDITAYAHIYASTNSGATMLLPVGVYGYEYYTLNSRQNYSATNSHSSFFVVADRDDTKVEITPSNPTSTGKPAGVPFTVTLNRGEVYQVLGAYISGAEGYDMTGSSVKAVPNSAGKCYPIAVFAGSTRTGLGCGTTAGSTGDVLFQQVFPSQAWGTKYLTAPTSNGTAANSLMTNIYRVMVKDPTTVVQLNGTALTGLVNNRYYQFESAVANYIESDKPIMVAQYMSSSGSCPNTTGDGDPELFYLSPVEQAIKYAPFYRNNLSAIDVNYLTLIISTGGLTSLTIDGSAIFDHTYPHSRPGYTVVVKRWAAGIGQSFVQSDSAFTGIVYGLGNVESYGYNVGTLVKNLNAIPAITNTLAVPGGTSSYTCKKTPFRFTILIPLKPTQLTWQFSQVPGLSSSSDVVQNNPAPVDSTVINGRMYYRFTVAQDYTFSNTGTFNVPIIISHPSIEGCSSSFERLLTVNVVTAPVADFTVNFSGCIGDAAQFNGITASAVPGVTATSYNWNFGDNTTSAQQNPAHFYSAPGTYDVQLRGVTTDGCLSDTTKTVVVNARPTLTLIRDSIASCPNNSVTFQVQNPVAGVTYNWYNAPVGGTLLFTGTTYVITVAGTQTYFVEAVQNGCAGTSRVRAVISILPSLTAPALQVSGVTTNSVTFSWAPVPAATGYEVSANNGATWSPPSSGATGTTHTIGGLQPLTTVSLIVRALGGCQEARSGVVNAKTLTDQVFIPNTFSPNGDGLNDVLLVYGNVIRGMQFTVFNQWGEKIFESKSQGTGWDGTYKGKPQPSGVYIYVARLTLNDGSVVDKKGSINLVR